MRLSRRSQPFDSDDYIFELKIDGFRSLAYVENSQCDLFSRNGNTFRNFKDLAQWIGENLRVENAVLNGEIACVDDSGRSVFNDLRWMLCHGKPPSCLTAYRYLRTCVIPKEN